MPLKCECAVHFSESDLNPVNSLLVVACKNLKCPIFFQAELFLRVSSSYTTHYSDGGAAPPVLMVTKGPNMGKPLSNSAQQRILGQVPVF